MNIENMDVPQNIQAIYSEYIDKTLSLEATRKPTDGLLGFGSSPSADPCHALFAEQLEQGLNVVAAEKPSAETVSATLHFVYHMPLLHKQNLLAYWMLLGVHALTGKLIALLPQAEAAELAAWYSAAYPKSVRLPAQKKVLAQLQEQAGETVREKSLFGKRTGRNL